MVFGFSNWLGLFKTCLLVSILFILYIIVLLLLGGTDNAYLISSKRY